MPGQGIGPKATLSRQNFHANGVESEKGNRILTVGVTRERVAQVRVHAVLRGNARREFDCLTGVRPLPAYLAGPRG